MRGLSRYAAVGAVATACHYALLTALVEWAVWAPGLAALAGSLLGALVAYMGNRRFTFTEARTPHGLALPRFAATAAVGAAANAMIVGGGAALGMHYLLMQMVATALVMLGTYQLNKSWTFGSGR